MRITVTTPNGGIIGPLDVPDEMELENFLALVHGEIPAFAQLQIRQLCLYHSGRLINDYAKNLKDLGLGDGDMVMITPARQPTRNQSNAGGPFGIDFSSIQVPGVQGNRQPGQQGNTTTSGASANPSGLPATPDPESVRRMLMADPASAALLRERNPDLAEALNSPEQFARVFSDQMTRRQSEALRRFQMLNADPFNPEVQRMIEEEIRQEEIESHMETAIEHMPETFAMVTMLYIRCKVNGHEVKAFVDSGAQATIMSESCARRCNITRLIDRRFGGVARGVGVSKIVGRIHMAQLQIENVYLPTSFNVLEDSGVDLLFGLDMLKRHQCIIDLKQNLLLIGTTGTTTEFLPESELPEGKHAPPTSPQSEDHQLAEALERSAAEAEAASLSASVAASNVRKSTETVPNQKDTGSTSTAGGSGTALPAGVTQEKVERLVSMGFPRDHVIRELTKTRGDMDKAAMALIAGSLPNPPEVKK